MKKDIKATFTLTGKEINEALYDFYVRKLKDNKIDAMFSEQDIKIDFYDFLEVSLTITEEKTLE